MSLKEIDLHDYVLYNIIETKENLSLKMLPTSGAFSSIDEVNFTSPEILINEVLPEDYGKVFWLRHNIYPYEGYYELQAVLKTQNGSAKKLIIRCVNILIKYDSVLEERKVYETWPRTPSTIRWLSAKSRIRIAHKWMTAGYMNEMVKNNIFMAIREAIQALYDKSGSCFASFETLYQAFKRDYLESHIFGCVYSPLMLSLESVNCPQEWEIDAEKIYPLCADLVLDIKKYLQEQIS